MGQTLHQRGWRLSASRNARALLRDVEVGNEGTVRAHAAEPPTHLLSGEASEREFVSDLVVHRPLEIEGMSRHGSPQPRFILRDLGDADEADARVTDMHEDVTRFHLEARRSTTDVFACGSRDGDGSCCFHEDLVESCEGRRK